MKVVRSYLKILVAEKAMREGRNISLRSISRDTSVPLSTVTGFANNKLREYPADALVKLCSYLNCQVGDLLVMEDIPDNG